MSGLKETRIKLNVSKEELSKLTKIPLNGIEYYENEEISVKDGKQLTDICLLWCALMAIMFEKFDSTLQIASHSISLPDINI